LYQSVSNCVKNYQDTIIIELILFDQE